MTNTNTDTRPQFEDAAWAHYQGLKARGWSHQEEGDPNSRESLFWRGWLMREALLLQNV